MKLLSVLRWIGDRLFGEPISNPVHASGPIDLDPYIGEWVAIGHGRVVAHGRTLDEMLENKKDIHIVCVVVPIHADWRNPPEYIGL